MSEDQIELVQTPRGPNKGYAKLPSTAASSRSHQSLLAPSQVNNESSPPPKCKRSCYMYYSMGCKNIRRKKCEFLLCFFSCLVVVTVTLLAKTVISKGSLIFLSMAQDSTGQRDIKIYQSGNRTEDALSFLNGTTIQTLIDQEIPGYPGASRILITTSKICEGHCNSAKRDQQIRIIAADTLTEKTIGLGTKFPFQQPLQERECLLSRKIAQNFDLKQDGYASLSLHMGRLFEILGSQYQFQRERKVKFNEKVDFECRIAGIYQKQGGRDNGEDIVYVELSQFFNNLVSYIQVEEGDREDVLHFLRSVSPKDYSQEIIFNLPSPRINNYLTSDLAQIQSKLTKLASQIISLVGPQIAEARLPVVEELQSLSMSAVFFRIVLNLVILLLVILSILLITTLLLQSIETKTAQIGALRMLGMNKCDLLWIFLTQALLFAVPALILGFILTFPCLAIVSTYFQDSVGYGFDPVPSYDAILITILIGFLIPAAASLIPLGSAVQATISDSIDFTRSRTRGVLINILKRSNSGVVKTALIGVIVIGFSGAIYYLLPYGIVANDLPLLAITFFVILIAMLLGFTLLALNFQHILEIIVVKVLFCWQSKANVTLVLKNLAAHRLHNQKTALLYSLSIGFTIMIVASYSMQLRQTQLWYLKTNGVYLNICSSDSNVPICQSCIIKAIKENPEVVADYSLDGFPADLISNRKAQGFVFSDRSRMINYPVRIRGVGSNYFDPLIPEFLKVNTRSSSRLSLSEQLYTARGSQGFGSGKFIQDVTSIHNSSDTALISLVYPKQVKQIELHPMWATDYAFVLNMGNKHWGPEGVMVSLPTFRKIMDYSSITEIPVSCIRVKFQEGVTRDQVEKFIGDSRNSFPVEQVKRNLQIFDFHNNKQQIDSVQSLLDTIFTLVLVIVMLLCFFSLSGSMSSNIYHQAKEIAILRAIGLKRQTIILIYIEEAFVIVFSSGLQGLIIGVALGYLLFIQQALFIEVPLVFYFPTWQLAAMFVTSVFTAIVASCLPARSLLSRQIAQIIRSND